MVACTCTVRGMQSGIDVQASSFTSASEQTWQSLLCVVLGPSVVVGLTVPPDAGMDVYSQLCVTSVADDRGISGSVLLP